MLDIVPRLNDEYEQFYYAGLILERRAKALLESSAALGATRAYEWLREAMTFYDRAETIRPENNDDAILR